MSYGPPIKNSAYVFAVALRQQADTRLFQSAPTLAAGDFRVSIDGAAFANLASLPVVSPAADKLVLISLTAAEMNGDNIAVMASDAAGAQWCDELWNIQPQTEGIVLRTAVQGLRVAQGAAFAAQDKYFDAKLDQVRHAVLDLQQSLLRGR